MMRRLVLLSAAAAIGLAQSSLAPPLIGIVRDPAGQVRRIFGVSGNLISGPVERSGVLAAEFTGRSGMIKTDAELILLDRQARPQRSFAAPPGPAVFEFDGEGMPRRCTFANGEVWDLSSAAPGIATPRDPLLTRAAQYPAPVAGLARMGESWLAAPPFAIQLTSQGPRVYRLPEAAKR